MRKFILESVAICIIAGGCAQDPALHGCAAGECPSIQASAPAMPVPIAKGAPSSLDGCAAHHYTMDATFGTQTPVKLPLLFDTGSIITSVATTGCTECGSGPLYSPGPGALADGNTTFVEAYGTGSQGYAGKLYQDSLQAGNEVAVSMRFMSIDSAFGGMLSASQCIKDVTQPAPRGFLGMARFSTETGVDVETGSDAFIHVAQDANVFAVQLCDLGGQVWFGGYAPNATTGSPVSLPVVGDATWSVYMKGVTLGKAKDFIIEQPALVDTGTGALGLPASAAEQFGEALFKNDEVLKVLGDQFFLNSDCIPMPKGDKRESIDRKFPSVTLHLEGPDTTTSDSSTVTLTVGATRSYLNIRYDASGKASLCPALGTTTRPVIGATIMHDFVTVFNNSARTISFAPQSGCDAILAQHQSGTP